MVMLRRSLLNKTLLAATIVFLSLAIVFVLIHRLLRLVRAVSWIEATTSRDDDNRPCWLEERRWRLPGNTVSSSSFSPSFFLHRRQQKTPGSFLPHVRTLVDLKSFVRILPPGVGGLQLTTDKKSMKLFFGAMWCQKQYVYVYMESEMCACICVSYVYPLSKSWCVRLCTLPLGEKTNMEICQRSGER